MTGSEQPLLLHAQVAGYGSEEAEPPLVEAETGHLMRCHIPLEELRRLQVDDRQRTPA